VKILVTGGTGFFGTLLKERLKRSGHHYINLDIIESPEDTATGQMALADLRDADAVEAVFQKHGPFDAVCHLAAALAHEVKDPHALWDSNVEGTRHLAEAVKKHHVPNLIFTSTNCLWGKPLNRPVREDDAPCPVEIYGRSKLAAEKVLAEYTDACTVVIFRSPTIIAPGRIGLLGMLFDFIAEGRRLPVIGAGIKPYQFIYAEDYADAIEKALTYSESDTFNIGSDNPTSLEQSYRYVIDRSHSKSRIYHLPQFPLLALMKLAYHLKISPLGPYHYGMIAEEFVFDTSRIKERLQWSPTKTNGEILYTAFQYYIENKKYLEEHADSLPAHRKASKMGIIKLLKWLS
jgi:nucleoside-diphosphate-sugar epimerase